MNVAVSRRSLLCQYGKCLASFGFSQSMLSTSIFGKAPSISSTTRVPMKPLPPVTNTRTLFPPRPDHSLALQGPVEGRIILQMDQAASAHKTLLRHQRQRGENPDLDLHLCLRAGRDFEKATGVREESLQHFADFERQRI